MIRTARAEAASAAQRLWSAAGAVLLLAIATAIPAGCALGGGGAYYDGAYDDGGYGGGYYEPYGYEVGGWGGGYHVGPGRRGDYGGDRGGDHGGGRAHAGGHAYHAAPAGRRAPSIPSQAHHR